MNYLDLENLYEKKDTELNVFPVNEAFKKGTIFKSLYDPYKNYSPKEITSNNEQAKMMLEIQKYKAVVHDLSLYLDVYPNDQLAVDLRSKYSKRLKEICNQYNKIYPPIDLSAEENNVTPWKWSTTRWVWEMGNNVDV